MKCQAILTLIAVVVLTAPAAFAQNVCTKQVDNTPIKFSVRNATDKSITVNYVDESCKESPSDDKIEPGRAFSGDTYNGHAFRVREAGSNKLLQEVVASPSSRTVTIGNIKNPDPKAGFLETLNRVRRGRGLPAMEYDDSLTQACQWFADLMAKYDKGGHDAVLVGGSAFADMQHPDMRTRHFNYAGNGGTEATGEGDWSDIGLIGGDSMMGWASSNTHYRPFLALDNQEFKQVGFAYAKSAKKGNYYYTCAVFGNPVEKEAVKSEVPAGLKFNEVRFFQTVNGEEKYAATFTKSSLDELNGAFSFDNPTSQPFAVEARKYFNGKVLGFEAFKDLKGSGELSFTVAGESGKTGKVPAGAYRIEILLNGTVVLSAEAVVK